MRPRFRHMSAACWTRSLLLVEAVISDSAEVRHLPYVLECVLLMNVRFSCDETKRQANLSKHGVDFADAEKVFAGPLVLVEDNRQDYGERRMIGIGAPGGRPPPHRPGRNSRCR